MSSYDLRDEPPRGAWQSVAKGAEWPAIVIWIFSPLRPGASVAEAFRPVPLFAESATLAVAMERAMLDDWTFTTTVIRARRRS